MNALKSVPGTYPNQKHSISIPQLYLKPPSTPRETHKNLTKSQLRRATYKIQTDGSSFGFQPISSPLLLLLCGVSPPCPTMSSSRRIMVCPPPKHRHIIHAHATTSQQPGGHVRPHRFWSLQHLTSRRKMPPQHHRLLRPFG